MVREGHIVFTDSKFESSDDNSPPHSVSVVFHSNQQIDDLIQALTSLKAETGNQPEPFQHCHIQNIPLRDAASAEILFFGPRYRDPSLEVIAEIRNDMVDHARVAMKRWLKQSREND